VETHELLSELTHLLGDAAVTSGDAINPDDLHDESLHLRKVTPLAVLRPSTTAEVQAIVRFAGQYGLAVTPRGSGTGLSGGATPVNGGLVVSFSKMNQVLSIDTGDHVAVVQPGITLRELDDALRGHGLRYPVYPGELSGSLGGNVNTNAGGMRAVRHGVTRQHVLGLEMVLMDGSIIRSGGPVVKSSSGYDITQLVIGSEGTLALVTEITLKLSPQMECASTILAPFSDVETVTAVVPQIVSSGLEPAILEYLDVLTMASVTGAAGLELGVNAEVAQQTLAYLIIVLETRTPAQLEGDIEALGELLERAGALDVYVLPSHSATALIEAREKAFWNAKAAGAHEIIDVVVPRSKVPPFIARAQEIAHDHESFLVGCGHVGDGNVHFSLYQPDDEKRAALLHELFAYAVSLGGAISGEHGIGMDKQADFLALSDPLLIGLQRQIKAVFDPRGLLNPHRLLDERPSP
jgi:glycolate oxidase